jgi:hypothetical protein
MNKMLRVLQHVRVYGWDGTHQLPQLDQVASQKKPQLEQEKHRVYNNYRLWWDNIIELPKVELIDYNN